MAHGWLYVLYLVVGRRPGLPGALQRGRTLGILIAGTMPFASFFAEAAVHKDLKGRDLLPSR